MDEPKKDPALINQKLETKLCLNCGFPNRESDKRCMYCKTTLLGEVGLISWLQQTYYILRWRRQLKYDQNKTSNQTWGTLPLINLFGYLFIGVALSSTGAYLFARALSQNSLSTGLISIVLLFYGVFTLKSLFVNK